MLSGKTWLLTKKQKSRLHTQNLFLRSQVVCAVSPLVCWLFSECLLTWIPSQVTEHYTAFHHQSSTVSPLEWTFSCKTLWCPTRWAWRPPPQRSRGWCWGRRTWSWGRWCVCSRRLWSLPHSWLCQCSHRFLSLGEASDHYWDRYIRRDWFVYKIHLKKDLKIRLIIYLLKIFIIRFVP